jgi:TPR repeat protein
MATKRLVGRSLLAIGLVFGLWLGGYHAYRAVSFYVYEQHARANDPEAQYRLGLRYLERGPRADVERAIVWFNKALQNGHAKARAGLGRAYRAMGVIVYKRAQGERDFKKAANWFRRAVSHGNAYGLLHLAALHEKGQGVPKDPTKSVSLLRRSARLGNGWALYGLYQYQQHGRGGLSKDPLQAYMWLYLAAHHSDASGEDKSFFAGGLERARRDITESQTAKAKRMSREWMRRYRPTGGQGS